MELVSDEQNLTPDAELTQRLIDACREEGMLVIKCGTYRNAIRFLPPINTPEEQLTEALTMLDKACEKVLSHRAC